VVQDNYLWLRLDLVYLRPASRFFVRFWICLSFLTTIFLILNVSVSYADQIQIPPWIKNNAKWWSQGQIGDSDFVKGIQYLIDQQIIKIQATNSTSYTQSQIPVWIRNNAGWWADGTIGDEDFVKGIQYLVQMNIIHVNSGPSFSLSSSAFEDNGTIPSQYTCDGNNTSPPLAITGIPVNAKSLALIVDDVDAPRGIFTHWIVWNIMPNKTQFFDGENIGFPQGTNSAGTKGYHGPCPPSGSAHRYYFKLYALDSLLNIDVGTTKTDLQNSMNGHIIDQATLVGKYSR
jgi:Raf kinase inhibitor-like YbhB/YbcL family protein